MFDALHEMSDWLLGFADSEWAVFVLTLTSFTESIFFPIPPDPLLIGMAIASPGAGIWYAGLATVASVSGALVGHWLGLLFGRPLLERIFSADKIAPVEKMFNRYGLWAVLLAAFTPLPYKLFAILAGVLHLDRKTFVVASLIGRGGRFLAIGVLIFVFGEDIEKFLDENFQALTLVVGGAAGAAMLIAAALYARHRSSGAASKRVCEKVDYTR